MSSPNETELRETICSVFRGKPVERVELFGSAARGGMTPQSDVDILVTPSPAATRRDLFVMAAEVEDAVGRQVDFLIRADVEAMKNIEARDLILDTAVTLYASLRKSSLDAYREAAVLVARYVEGVSEARILEDTLRQDAVIRRIQIIGEAVRHLSQELLSNMPDFPAKEARGMRNILVHDYEGVNIGRVWDTAIEDIPVLRAAAEKYLQTHS